MHVRGPESTGDSASADKQIIEQIAADPFIKHIAQHSIKYGTKNDAVDYPDVNWVDEMTKHAEEKFGADPNIIALGLVKCASNVLAEEFARVEA